MHLYGEICYKVILLERLAAKTKLTNDYVLKKMSPWGCLALLWSYIHEYDDYFQTSSLKLFSQSRTNFIKPSLEKGT